jgi:hypothetical protein
MQHEFHSTLFKIIAAQWLGGSSLKETVRFHSSYSPTTQNQTLMPEKTKELQAPIRLPLMCNQVYLAALGIV